MNQPPPQRVQRGVQPPTLRLDGCLQVPLDGLDSTVEPYSPLLGGRWSFWREVFSIDDSRLKFFDLFKLSFWRTQTVIQVFGCLEDFTSGPENGLVWEFVFKFFWSLRVQRPIDKVFVGPFQEGISPSKPTGFDSKWWKIRVAMLPRMHHRNNYNNEELPSMFTWSLMPSFVLADKTIAFHEGDGANRACTCGSDEAWGASSQFLPFLPMTRNRKLPFLEAWSWSCHHNNATLLGEDLVEMPLVGIVVFRINGKIHPWIRLVEVDPC